ncbi:voltage-gated hydrogen channel 1-like [Symsagittifera roscoffensis]|uniref:voltage-gated hydrogen channel 1-like n=1 Tax=Symsagittifera roscoffensis TaxID=84072 RepID=UPI00307C8AB7
MSAGFQRLNDDHEILVNENSGVPLSEPSSTPTQRLQSGSTFHDRWRLVLRNLFSHLHFDIGIIMFVMLYTSLIMLEMIINLDMLKVHHSSPVPRWLHLMSLSILVYFVIEVILRIYAFGYEILYQKFELFDITVILTTFVFEMIFIQHEDAFSTTGLLILMRMWRFGNIINGLIKNVQNEKSRQIRTLQKEIESYRSTNTRLTEKNERLERKVRFYEMEMESRGISVEYETFEDLQADEVELRSPTSPVVKSPTIAEGQSSSRLGDGHLAFQIPEV